eukprot:1638016-Prymnesium_polylepis.1
MPNRPPHDRFPEATSGGDAKAVAPERLHPEAPSRHALTPTPHAHQRVAAAAAERKLEKERRALEDHEP